MKPKLMVSYSRQQIPFVDELYKSLVKAGYDVWLDYQRLVPSEAWFDQITAGVKNADIVLLVVSKDSMASKNVKDEWELALKDGKRVILVLFEATPIENEQLKKCEYVDFRTNYKAGLKQLDALLNSEPQPEEKRTLVPESGFKASFTFWVVLVTSLLLAVGSISVAWTVFLPFILMPLPMRIFQRNYNFSQVAPTLFMMPIFFVFSASILRSEGNIFYLLPQFVFTFGAIAAILSWVLLVLLLTPAIRLRARPEAVPARAVNRTKIVEEVKHKSVKFFIDHAPEDGKYAKVLRRVLEKHEHEFVEGDKNPEAVFVLLSTYKNKTIYKAGNGLSLFPIVLQKPGNVDGELGKIQWLDFRRGLKNLEKIAKLLPEPAKLVRALAVPPTGRQDVFPLPVNALQFFYLVTGVLGGGGLLTTIASLIWLQLLDLEVNVFNQILVVLINGLLLFATVFYSVKALRTRMGGLAAVYPLLVLTVFQAALHAANFAILGLGFNSDSNSSLMDLMVSASNPNGLAFVSFFFLLVAILPFIVFSWSDFYRWLPMSRPVHVSKLEKMLLLYTPDVKLKLFFHILFHASIFILLLVESIIASSNVTAEDWSFAIPCFMVPALFIALFSRWMATRTPKKST
jgi:hypothetical protein